MTCCSSIAGITFWLHLKLWKQKQYLSDWDTLSLAEKHALDVLSLSDITGQLKQVNIYSVSNHFLFFKITTWTAERLGEDTIQP